MPDIATLKRAGDAILATYTDDTTQWFYPTQAGVFITPIDAGPPDVGDDGGDGSNGDDDTDPNPTAPPAEDPDPVTPPANGIDLYNPWKNVAITGSWENHMSYSAGGIDYPLSYGTPIKAPANGTLHISGGSGEYAVGQVGSAGRRSILYFDKQFPRKKGRGSREAEGPMRALVLQHQSKFGRAKHYNKGDIIGYSGASANGSDYGGDVHLHIHGLNAAGRRLNFLNYFG